MKFFLTTFTLLFSILTYADTYLSAGDSVYISSGTRVHCGDSGGGDSSSPYVISTSCFCEKVWGGYSLQRLIEYSDGSSNQNEMNYWGMLRNSDPKAECESAKASNSSCD